MMAAAEQHAGGKATKAKVEREGGTVEYEIEGATTDNSREADANGQDVSND
jgi:uncharacterized membrane protein YkoI